MTTIRDVAQEAGVSIATVSYVLNDTGAVSQSTRRRVLRAVKKLNYRPSVIAQGLRARESRIIGYTWRPVPANQLNPILDKFMQHMTLEAARHGYHVLTFPESDSPSDDPIAIYADMMATGRVDGFILSNTNVDDQRIQHLLDAGFPFITFGRSNPDWVFPWVDVDGQDGIRQVVDHMLQLNHERIACLAWPEDSLTGRQRLEGYRSAMQAAGVAIDPRWVVRVTNDYELAYQATASWLRLPEDRRPTAVVAFADPMAAGAMNAAADAGLDVGRDVAVAGFDDAPFCEYLQPPLTSIRQPIAAVAERMVGMLVELVRGQQPEPAQVLLEPRLIVRDSTARNRVA